MISILEISPQDTLKNIYVFRIFERTCGPVFVKTFVSGRAPAAPARWDINFFFDLKYRKFSLNFLNFLLIQMKIL